MGPAHAARRQDCRSAGFAVIGRRDAPESARCINVQPEPAFAAVRMARLGLWTWNWTALLTLADARARSILEAHFREHAEAGRLQDALARSGLL
ncbi:MAG: hypothetical protein C5B53_06725 [Candidatus Melainabacteria bacterium]|nr:MAG: hypothetical protein C5B53_06725 [Candidatus Melainabacteria bacterium]